MTFHHAPEDASSHPLRKSGIRVLPEIAWGSHLGVFYQTQEDLLDTNVAYFGAGLAANEFCLWAVSGNLTLRKAKNALRRSIPHFDQYWETGQVELVPGSKWYLDGGKFDLKRITTGWNNKLRAALGRGYVEKRQVGSKTAGSSRFFSQ
jgi:hypothetical protein